MSFKGSVFTDATIHLNRLYPTQKCAPRSQSSCKTKWNNLKKTYNAVKNIKTLSGFAWSDEHGVGVTPETSGTWDTHTKAHPQSKLFTNKGFPHFDMVEEKVVSASVALSFSLQMLPSSSMSTQPHAVLLPPLVSSSNPMDLSNLAAAIAEAPPLQTPLAAPTSTHLPTSTFMPTTSNSKLMSVSRGKHKHSALGDNTDSSWKHSCPSSAAAKAHQESSTALTTIAQVLPLVVDSFAVPPPTQQQDECPPPTTLGCAISLLCTTDGLTKNDVLILTNFMMANPNEAIAFLALHEHGPSWRTSWALRKLAALCGNAH
ncbi:hypothetical protein BDR04DRAFT_1153634 [Suillus decipiens]|nr:hypothetical protein BDR04DRAFT_1153634 [Suillus decipiens]